ncbi:hypothetical protein GE21DRAFT_1216118 [Neurospora crassa]|nr:hypothetical protein GE21DRAFT_1216118 [Neurospora crassa]
MDWKEHHTLHVWDLSKLSLLPLFPLFVSQTDLNLTSTKQQDITRYMTISSPLFLLTLNLHQHQQHQKPHF